ncbi:hypothetical protein JD844_027550 [Phrynosoma platyrhinos]|uniref:FGFR1 oncogene partner 2 n=1 Tax=Phrynosoma platyrhinos TaxID=52577 RepID=A0ABQ7SGL8_PHRPL|nr:hypothetical protein JD844_027550 [Phrynosoma platyrhinos]
MSCTIEKALADAKALVERLREHDNAAEALIEQTTALNKRVEAMKQLRTSLEEHQSALELIMSKYREQMFRLLMASKKDDPGIIVKLKEQHSKMLKENPTLIDSKILVQAFGGMMQKPLKQFLILHLDAYLKELQVHVDQITEMAAVMRKAIDIDEQQGCKEQERIFQLEQENKGLREILQITRESFLNLKEDASESTSLSALVTNSDLSLRKS